MSNLEEFTDPFDDDERLSARETFRRLGFEPLPPSALDDFQLRGRLWEFIYAMAGQQIYMHRTDHISDRQLYTWLHDEWLEEESASLEPEPDGTCHMDMTDFNNGTDPIIWLKYFATEKQRNAFAAEHSLESIPAHVDPPHDRDRWLPEPPGIPADLGDEGPIVLDDDEKNDEDPLGLEKVDAEIQAQKQSNEQSGTTGVERAEGWQRPVDQLRRAGVSLLPPDELTDETITAKLWELLHHLACQSFYALNTNHLNDRELYAALWTKGLRDEALLPGKSKTRGWFHDFLGSGSDEDMQISLRYYASDEERAEHAREWPEDPIPPKEQPPFNRDWRLPKGPFG